MWDRLKQFNDRYYKEIAWFFIGYFLLDSIIHVGRGDWTDAIISIILIAINLWLYIQGKNE